MSDSNELSNKQPPVQKKIDTHFIKSNYFRVIHADGAWGGLTPQLNIQMALFNERRPIPQVVTYEVGSEQLKEVNRSGKQGLIREVEVDVILGINAAKALRDWLSEKITEAEKVVETAEAGKAAVKMHQTR